MRNLGITGRRAESAWCPGFSSNEDLLIAWVWMTWWMDGFAGLPWKLIVTYLVLETKSRIHSRHKTVDKYRTVDITTMECFGIGTRILEEKKAIPRRIYIQCLGLDSYTPLRDQLKRRKYQPCQLEDHCQGGAFRILRYKRPCERGSHGTWVMGTSEPQ